MQFTKIIGVLLLSCVFSFPAYSQKTVVQGTVTDINGAPLPGTQITIKKLSMRAVTDQNGHYQFALNKEGTYIIKASCLGFKPYKKKITFGNGEQPIVDFILIQDIKALNQVVITAKSQLQQIEAMAFNVDVLNAEKLQNTTLSAAKALNRVSGVRVRQSGGVGSQMKLSINGFTGRQVKVFINGVPMSNFGSAFQLNNIPVDIIKHIEVYKGVVPIHLGADALGGAVNIVTEKYEKTHVDLSFSYGSFNTYKSSLNAVYVANSGFTAQIKAFQNYSDNNYWMNVDVANLKTGEYYENQRVRRFHDTYHNETVIAQVGVLNTAYADHLLVGITLGQKYDEIQTGARVESVFGAWHTEGTVIMPSLKYKKTDFLTKGLDVSLTANYNFGKEKIVDTINRRYNWYGDYIEYDKPGGERSYNLYEYRNNTGVVTANINYAFNNHHSLALSNTLNSFNREGHDKMESEYETYSQPKKSVKNVLGLAYRYEDDNWSSSVFLKNYSQVNKFMQPYNPTGDYGDVAYRHKTNRFNNLGYGITGTYFFTENFQVKASFEKSYRLPSPNELYGNNVSLAGNIELDPETSYNYNLGASYWTTFHKNHRLHVSINGFYRDAHDFIRARLNANQAMQVMDNLMNVTSTGGSIELDYAYKNAFNFGLNMTYQDLRNNTKYVGGQTAVSPLYRDRIPNMPYLFGGANAAYNFKSPINQHHEVHLEYNLMYVHSFYLFWPSMGDQDRKFDIPKQISHNLSLTYTLGKENNLHLTLTCRNLTDNKLYDNFSLQKPGRSFSAKIRYSF